MPPCHLQQGSDKGQVLVGEAESIGGLHYLPPQTDMAVQSARTACLVLMSVPCTYSFARRGQFP